ncbi:probable cytochrome P450 6a23 [Thrips palmi]|uniref:Probable cytochrome P450 6a23 n=1 Tax=Thrips palmi TaxID=161013 RepID=A0A6P8ZKD4_THRPL|nr:probable cytochrome P450 6a23 [Thrips palmi]
MVETTSVLAALAAVLVAAYFWSRYRHGYWRKRGVPTPSPLPIFGNMLPVLRGKKHFMQAFHDMSLPHRDTGYCGMYVWGMPMLMVFEPEMVKQVVCKDFSSFHDRGIPSSESDPLSQHLFNLTGTKWRNLRNRLTPTFTSGKLKLMLPLMRDISDQLSTAVAAEAKAAGGEVDVQALLPRFATDVIGSVAFGINCNSLANENAEFLTMSRGILRQSLLQTIRGVLEAIYPGLSQLLPFKWTFNKVHHFFTNLMRETVGHRETNKVVRNDFVHLLMQVRDQDLGHADPENQLEMTPGLMAAQAFLFFVAGQDNIANLVAFCLHQMVLDQDLQQRAADEVRNVIRKHDGQLTYEALKDMSLLDRVLMEGLRLWSPVGTIFRKCNQTTKVGDLVVEKDMPVMIIADNMHRNPALFPDPERFDPERHTAEAKEQRHPYALLPFGEGPRVCIAERFSMLEMKLALAVMLRDFSFSRGPKFEVEPARDPKSFFPQALHGFPMRVQVRG